ncbi:MAG: hypothetical protein P4M05_26495 [Bradyrhizobium sp.]|nr:hypothetical protein [Bradyrhizobium sp.]
MFKDWKICTFNGCLMASYFIPAWAIPALKIVISPVHGLYYERANIAPAMFISDYLQFGALATVRFAWLLALAKLTVVAFFAVFLVLTLRVPTRNRGASDEALALALLLGGLVSFASMVLAAKVGEPNALRLHATELLLLLSIGIVMLVETAPPVVKPVARPIEDRPAAVLPDGYPLGSVSS